MLRNLREYRNLARGLVLGALGVLLIASLGACGGDDPTATPVPPAATATPTAIAADPTPTAMAAKPTPTPNLSLSLT